MRWPFWLSPRQALVVPISSRQDEYARTIAKTLHDHGFYADADLSSETMQKKVREGQIQQYNYILVVGEREQSDDTADLRDRSAGRSKPNPVKITDVVEKFRQHMSSYT